MTKTVQKSAEVKEAMTRQRIVIAVTALNAVDSPGPGMAVIRAIRECPDFEVTIIGLAYESLEPGIFMHDMVDKTYQIPYPSAGTSTLLERLTYINSIEHINVLVPNFDAELFNFIKISDDLLKIGIRTFLPAQKEFEAREKINLSRFGKKYDLLMPDDKAIYQVSELPKAVEKFGFPMVVKGKFYEAVVCNTLEQAEKVFYQLQAKWGLPVIVQEFVKGTELNVAALGDGTGEAISVVAMRKLFITDKGKAWAGITIDDELLIQEALKFIKATKWRGGCELEIMMTSDRKPYIMEVNPRFPAWIYLTAAAGQNQPAALIKLALGQKVAPQRNYEIGKIFVRYSWDLIVNLSEFHKISGFGEL